MNTLAKPQVKVDDALRIAGNQNRLAKLLGINRVCVHAWVKSGREYLPDLQSARMAMAYPELVKNNSGIEQPGSSSVS